MGSTNSERIVVLIDMDCFFCQVETKLQPEYAGKPLAVVQYNQWQLGGIIAVNYEARAYGITRHMRGEEAKEKCPDLLLASVPCLRGKADTSRYRSAGREVINVMKEHCNVIERASVDEAYLDITDIVEKRIAESFISPEQLVAQLSNTFVIGHSEVGKNDEEERSKGLKTWISNIFEELEDAQAQKLAVAGVIVEELRADIFKQTGFRCSAGIAQNKILAKLACGLHKPNRQTILPAAAISLLYSTLPIKKVRNLGGKFGDVVVESLNCNVMGDLLQYSLQYLQKRFDDKTGLWLYNIARGIDNEPVIMRLMSKSIGACKKFPGKQAIVSIDLKHWAGELSAEVCERLEQDLEENERRATLLTICFHYYQKKTTVSQSRSCTLTSYKPEKMASRCVDVISKSTQCPIAYLGISAGKFVQAKGSENFRNFFKPNKLDLNQKGVEVENKNVEYVQSVSNVAETVTNNLERNISTSVTSSNVEVKYVSNSKVEGIPWNSRTSVQLDEQVPNTNTDWSPTSRRLNNLIRSLNERNKKKTFIEKEFSNTNLNDSLDQSEYKQSFFMNVLHSNEVKLNDADTRKTVLTEFVEKKNTDKYAILKKCITKPDEIKNDEEEEYIIVANSSKKSDSSEFHLNTNQYNYKTRNSNEIGQEKTHLSVTKNSNNAINLQSTIKLQEIFPDLNNIDPSVVALLPSDLQEEAKPYMKAQNTKSHVKETTAKHSKTKSKSKTNISKAKKNNGIYSFLVKNSVSDFTAVLSKKCLECYQIIPVSKYDEHCDFHIAEKLQRELNNPALQTENVKRKVDTCDVSMNSIKRRPNVDLLKSDKNHKTITSFLS
ncbi:DNA polymerase eta isoform X2 [Calliopsis andreniformis]|uniref:DNA polymerase eta isoform X2 n=1 Tax=Calliopsis andreniformis TaxID=337506 RepID=UPI003FCE32EF